MSGPAEVKAIYESNFRDVPRMLRKLADRIEEGEHGHVCRAVCVVETENGTPAVFGWGDTELLGTIGLLNLGISELCDMRRGLV